jgi:hypothetical protein
MEKAMSGWYLLRWPLVVLVIALGGAYMFRYEPLVEDNSLRLAVVWDRWTYQVCVYGFFEARQLSCSPEALAASAGSSARGEASESVSRVDQLRSAGFSLEEISAWVAKETKALKSQGVSDAEIARYFADSKMPRPRGILK